MVVSERSFFEDEFHEACELARNMIKEMEYPVIITHHDADGISASGVLMSFFKKEPIKIVVLSGFDPVRAMKISKLRAENIVFLDLGSGQVNTIKRYLSGAQKIVILDHHKPEIAEFRPDFPGKTEIVQVNAHLFGLDGSKEISGAGVAYAVTKLRPELALVGAIGDMQFRYHEKGRLVGYNYTHILPNSAVEERLDITLYGRETRPIYVALGYCTEPFLPGLTGDKKACLNFLKSLRIPLKDEYGGWKTIADLAPEEKTKLVDGLVKLLIRNGVPLKKYKSLVGFVYRLPNEKPFLRDLREYSTMLNACGRLKRYEVGLKVVQYDKNVYDREKAIREAAGVLVKYKKMLAEGIKALNDVKKGGLIESLPNITATYVKDVINDRIVGVVLGMALGGRIIDFKKPALIAADMTEQEGMVKISARALKEHIKRGVNLREALVKAKNELKLEKSEAGGHDIAAGAIIPKEKLREYIKHVDEKIGEQIMWRA